PWPTRYRVPYVDAEGREELTEIAAGSKREAISLFARRHPEATFDPQAVTVSGRWPPFDPPPGERFSHAWFGGFLQPRNADGSPDWSRPAPVAFSVLVEFGGSGGRTSGPLAKEVARVLVEVLGPDLRADPLQQSGGV
ncbi:MAG: hypothetical protein D6788_05590, partial [Planctomycetota bacterium]